jgi:uncharacterized protein (DUF1697 family)
MRTYIAMLRGVNVSGHKIIKMDQLRASFTALGFSDVKTYVQSGNVVFKAESGSTANLTKKIEQKVLDDFGFSVPVFVTTSKEIHQTIERNPFLKDPKIDRTKLHFIFLSGDPPKTAHELLLPLAVKPEQFHVVGREIYLYCPNGYGNTKLSNTTIERKLSVGATTRNWNTVNKLLAMTQ